MFTINFISRTIFRKLKYIDTDKSGNLVNMTIEHAKANADIWEFSYQELPKLYQKHNSYNKLERGAYV